MKALLPLLLVPCFVAGATSVISGWQKFKADHGKVYASPTEEAYRLGIFQQNVAKIEEHNKKGLSWTEGINQFTDLTKEEFVRLHARGKIQIRRQREPVSHQNFQARIAHLPDEVDWRKEGVVTKVRNQGQCGSCWAFASSSVMASYAALANRSHPLLELSPQHIVSCSPNTLHCGGNGGCSGSIEPLAFTYASLYGVATEEDYPYVSGNGGNDRHCDFDAKNTEVAVMTMGFETLPHNDAVALMTHLATIGPLSASVAASDWGAYSGGVFDGCDYNGNMAVNHAVMLVGYGSDPTEGDYWIIKNSWGPSWGEQGYIRLKRQAEPKCGTDYDPLDGSACEDSGIDSVQVCGTCAVVSENSYPIGTTFVN